MAVEFGNLLTYIRSGATGSTQAPAAQVAPAARYKNPAIAAIKYEKMPAVTDTVPTKDQNGNPLLAGYVTPNQVWVA